MLRRRRFDYDALLVYEVGKSWPEADGDIAEAIDFLEYYAREALRYGEPQPVVPMRASATSCLHSARRRRGDSSVELCRRDHDRA